MIVPKLVIEARIDVENRRYRSVDLGKVRIWEVICYYFGGWEMLTC
jgi:hypothetical protein